MGHIQSIIESLKQKQVQASTAAPPKQQSFDLPGDHRGSNINLQNIKAAKREYNRCLKWLRDGNKKLQTLKAKDKKQQLRKEIGETKAHMTGLLDRIGSYADEEKVFGFKEVQDGN